MNTPEQNETELVARAAALTSAVEAMANQVEGLGRKLARSRLQVVVLTVSVALDLILSLAFFYALDSTNDAQARTDRLVEQVADTNTAAVTACNAVNEAAGKQRGLWEGLLALPSDNPPPIPETLAAFNTLLDEAFAEQDCAALAGVNEVLLGPTPLQTVTNRVDGVEGPAARYGDTLVVEGQLCNRTAKPVNVLTTLSWQAVAHDGTFFVVGVDIPQTRIAGCEDFTGDNAFRNPMPAEVVAASKAIGPAVAWVVQGFEVPILADGAFGTREEFTSEPFMVVP